MHRPVDFECLMVDVEGRVVLLAKDPLAEPLLQKPGRARVARPGSRITGFIPVEFQPDDVIRAGMVQPVLKGRVDHVVGGSDDVGQRSHACDVVADPAKRTHVGHRGSSFDELSGVALRQMVKSPFPSSGGISSVHSSGYRS